MCNITVVALESRSVDCMFKSYKNFDIRNVLVEKLVEISNSKQAKLAVDILLLELSNLSYFFWFSPLFHLLFSDLVQSSVLCEIRLLPTLQEK